MVSKELQISKTDIYRVGTGGFSGKLGTGFVVVKMSGSGARQLDPHPAWRGVSVVEVSDGAAAAGVVAAYDSGTWGDTDGDREGDMLLTLETIPPVTRQF